MDKQEKRRNSVIEEMRSLLDKAEGENRGLTEDENASYAKLEKEAEELKRNIARRKALEAEEREMNAVEERVYRPEVASEKREVATTESAEYREAFTNYIRSRGENRSVFGEFRTINTSDDSALVPTDIMNEIVIQRDHGSVMRQVPCRVIQISSPMTLPYESAGSTTAAVAEAGTFSVSEPTLSNYSFALNKIGHIVKVSDEMLRQSKFDVGAYIAGEAGRRIGLKEDAWMMAGNGSGAALGIFADTGITQVYDADTGEVTSNLLDYADFVGCLNKMETVYYVSALQSGSLVFFCSEAVMRGLRLLVDGNSRPLIQPDVTQPNAMTLLGAKIKVSSNVPADAASAKVAAFVDVSKYIIADGGNGVEMKVLDQTYAVDGLVGYRFQTFVDGKLVDKKAAAILKLAAS